MKDDDAIMGAKGWIEGDESAKEMLARVLTDRPFLLLPPLHRVPLRLGNVVELVGPSPSAKTHILMQATVNCILPKEWNGVYYGGLGHLVMFLDLDCRFDVSRLSQLLKHRIMEANGSCTKVDWEQKDVDVWNCCTRKKPNVTYDEELYVACMRRFLYIRCYDSFEFLATLKTLHYRLQKEREAHGISVHFLMIDSIGAFHWVDRASTSLPPGGNNRKSLSLQSVSETVVQEIRKLLLVHPMLVIATKATILGERYSGNEVKRKWSSSDNSVLRNVTSDTQQLPYRWCLYCFMIQKWEKTSINSLDQAGKSFESIYWELFVFFPSDLVGVVEVGIYRKEREREVESPDVIFNLKVSCAEALWKLSKGTLINRRKITKTKALLCLAKNIEERGELQSNCLMTVLEIAAVAESSPDLEERLSKLIL